MSKVLERKFSKVSKVSDTINQSMKSKYKKMYNDGKISKIERHILFSDEVNRIFAERYGFDYGFETYE